MLAQEGEYLRRVLDNIGYPQTPTLILCDNQCAVGLATNTVKAKRTKSTDMRYHWIRDRVEQGHFKVTWRPGEHNLADFSVKLSQSTHTSPSCDYLNTRHAHQIHRRKRPAIDAQSHGQRNEQEQIERVC